VVHESSQADSQAGASSHSQSQEQAHLHLGVTTRCLVVQHPSLQSKTSTTLKGQTRRVRRQHLSPQAQSSEATSSTTSSAAAVVAATVGSSFVGFSPAKARTGTRQKAAVKTNFI